MGNIKEYTQAIGYKVYSKVKEMAFFQLRRNRLVSRWPTRLLGNSFLRKPRGKVWESRVLIRPPCSKPVPYLWPSFYPHTNSVETWMLLS